MYQRVQMSVFDPSLIGDKPKWYSQHLQPVEFHVYDSASSLAAAITSVGDNQSDDVPTGMLDVNWLTVELWICTVCYLVYCRMIRPAQSCRKTGHPHVLEDISSSKATVALLFCF